MTVGVSSAPDLVGAALEEPLSTSLTSATGAAPCEVSTLRAMRAVGGAGAGSAVKGGVRNPSVPGGRDGDTNTGAAGTAASTTPLDAETGTGAVVDVVRCGGDGVDARVSRSGGPDASGKSTGGKAVASAVSLEIAGSGLGAGTSTSTGGDAGLGFRGTTALLCRMDVTSRVCSTAHDCQSSDCSATAN